MPAQFAAKVLATESLARRLEGAARDYKVTRYSGPGNPMGTQFLRQADLVATKMPFAPGNALMNTVHGLEDAQSLADVLSFYAATNQSCWVEVLPYTPVALTTALTAAGFRPESYNAALCASPLPDVAPPNMDVGSIAINQIDASELNTFLDTMNLGFGTPAGALGILRSNQSFWPQVETWHLFLARVDGQPAGAAVLSIHGELGYLAAGATLPAFRNRGVHGALLAARIATAGALGGTTISSQAAWGSTSQANMQRAGLGICHVKSVWTNRTPEI